MSGPERRTGGCLCGRLRWEAQGAPLYEGLCCCEDCRRASGSAFVGFQSYPADRARITGEVRESVARARHGGAAVRSACATCGSLVFGGRRGVDDQHTFYAGSLNEPALFRPTMAIFVAERAPWAPLPEGLALYATLPGRD